MFPKVPPRSQGCMSVCFIKKRNTTSRIKPVVIQDYSVLSNSSIFHTLCKAYKKIFMRHVYFIEEARAPCGPSEHRPFEGAHS